MARNRRNNTLLAATLWGLAAGPALADARTVPTALDVTVGYEVYAGGLHAGRFELTAEVRDGSYRLASSAQTMGLADVFFSLTSRAEAAGRLDGTEINPLGYRVDSRYWGRDRSIRLSFGETGAPIEVELIPPPEEDEREPVPPEMTRDAIDPLSAVIWANLSRSAEACDWHVPLYDGYRRFDVSIAKVGEEALTRTRFDIFEGRAARCEVTGETLAGERRDRPRRGREETPPGNVWIAEMPDLPGVWLPVRGRQELPVGTVFVYLARLEVRDPSTGTVQTALYAEDLPELSN